MIYEFAAKITYKDEDKNLNDDDIINLLNSLETSIEVSANLEDTKNGFFLLKGKASVSSLPAFEEAEFETAINDFKLCLEIVTNSLSCTFNEDEAFYHSTNKFGRVYE